MANKSNPALNAAVAVYWLVTAALFAYGLYMLAYKTPATPPEVAGYAQKIFYIHLPVAINTFLAAMLVFIGGFGYLFTKRLWWDDFAAAAGKTAVLLGGIVLLTGMIWGRSAWSQWWTWSPRLTFSLALWLLYVVYLMIRPSIESPNRRAMICSVYGVVAFLDVPLVYFSTKLIPEIHPTNINLAPEMQHTLLFWFAPITLMHIGMLLLRINLNRSERELAEAVYDQFDEPTPGTAATA